MPEVSLVVCLCRQHDLLTRLLQRTDGCYDDLVVVHDGAFEDGQTDKNEKPAAIDYSALSPEESLPLGYRVPSLPPKPGSIHALVHEHGGRYFEGGRSFQQEPHWPFAWAQSRNDWILRLDTDEFPSDELQGWLREFRTAPEPATAISGYTCIWPLWNGRRMVTKRWPTGRIFLCHKQRVRFFGMAEQVPVADTNFEQLGLALHHRPKRKSYGIRNILFRKQAYHWRRVIAQSLLKNPTELPRWRWPFKRWPHEWEQIRSAPLRTASTRLVTWPFYTAREALRHREFPYLSLVVQSGLHHFLICLEYIRARKRARTRPQLNTPLTGAS